MGVIRKYPLFLLLLPVFFVLHGYRENYDSVPVMEALLLTLVYIAAALLAWFLAWLYYRDITRASILAVACMAYYFFFGSMQDLMRKYFEGTFFARYSFILPVSLVLFVLLLIWLKKSRRSFKPLVTYLNVLMLCLIMLETGWLVVKTTRMEKGSGDLAVMGFTPCDSCRKPDIFFIVLDEYAGNRALKTLFNFDNSGFENDLRQRGFYVAPDSRSNYNYTPFAMASMLEMDYLRLNMKTKGAGNLNDAYQTIRNSRALAFLEGNGYQLHNYSIFDFDGAPAVSHDDFLATRTGLITSQTFSSRIWKDIVFNTVTGKWDIKPVQKNFVYRHLHNNNERIRLTMEAAGIQTNVPKFVYTHLMMPHYPYYFNSQGRPLPFDSLVEGSQHSKSNYVEYLRYCNQRILELTDSILISSPSPPVIILTSDHGFRFFTKEDREYCFVNFTAVYLPSADYKRFYSNMSGVNLFPVFFNTQFNQQIPLKKDSSIYLWE